MSDLKREVWVIESTRGPEDFHFYKADAEAIAARTGERVVRYVPAEPEQAGKAQGWLPELAQILNNLDHAETLHEDTMRIQFTYAAEDLGHFLAKHRAELRAALVLPAPPIKDPTNG